MSARDASQTSKERTQRWRERRERGVVMVAPVEVTENTIRKLIGKGYLDRGNGVEIRLSKADIIEAVQDVWNDWVR